MTEHTLLDYYLRELAALKKLGRTFGKEHPELAEHLQFEFGFGKNPQLAQLIEGLAFLNARVMHQFDLDEYEQVNTLANVLYPHVMQSIPATAVIEWTPAASLEKKLIIPRDTLLETDTRQSFSCRFSTIYDVALYPIKIAQAEISNDLNAAPTFPGLSARSFLHLRLKTLTPEINFAGFDLQDLNIYLNGMHTQPYHLFELLTKNCVKIAYQQKGSAIHWTSHKTIQKLGFAPDEYLLPVDARTADAHRILAEFFAMPQKFLFIKLTEFPLFMPSTQDLDIYFYFDSSAAEQLIKEVSHEQFKIGCTPIINLFPKIIEPLEIDNKQTEYRAVTDLREPENFEIHQIKKIYTQKDQKQIKYYQPLFYPNRQGAPYWQGKFVDCQQLFDCDYPGTELFLSFSGEDWVKKPESLVIETLCTNRHMPILLASKMPLPTLQQVHGKLPPMPIKWCSNLNTPMPSLMSRHKRYAIFKHLLASLQHYTNDNGQQLKQLLLLYLSPQQESLRKLIEGIKDLTAAPCSKFMKFGKHYGYHHGISLNLEFDREYSQDYNPCLFFTILQHFLIEHCSMNSFLKFRVSLLDKELYQWPISYGRNSIL